MDFEAPHLWVEYFLEELSLLNAEFHLSHCLFKSSRWRRGCLRKWQFVVSFLSELELGTKWWQGKKQTGTGRWVGDMALQQLCSGMQGWRLQRAEGNSWGREGRCSCEQKHGKAPRERTEGRLEKGQKLDATLREVQIWESTYTQTPTRSSCQNCYPGAVLAWTIQMGDIWFAVRGKFSKFPSILHRNETETSLDTCSERENKLCLRPPNPSKEKHVMVTNWGSLWFFTKKTSKTVKWETISWQSCKLWTAILTGNFY